jgi:hypothetical protein
VAVHLSAMALFAAAVAAVFGVLVHDAPRDQVRLGVRIFGGLVVGAYLVGWIMIGLYG